MLLGIDLTQILLHILNVVILFGGLYIILYKPVKDFIQGREDKYREMSEEATSKLAEAEKNRSEYEEKLSGVEEEIAAERRKAATDLSVMRQQMEQEAKESADKIIADAKKDAERQKQSIIDSAKKDITEMVEEATRKVILSGDTSDAYDMFLDNAERS